jgi:hypothetical protein
LDVSIAKVRQQEWPARLLCISSNPPPFKHKADSGYQFMRSVTQDKVRAGNLRRMEAHFQNWQAGIVMVHGVGDLSFFHPAETVANKSQIHFFTGFTQGFNLRQSQRGANDESLMLQQKLASCVEEFTGGNGQNFGHECWD